MKPLEKPTHTVIEIEKPLSEWRTIIYERNLKVLNEMLEDSICVRLNLDFDPDEKATEWTDATLSSLRMHWSDRLHSRVLRLLDDPYDNPEDPNNIYNPDDALRLVADHLADDRWDLAVSESLKYFSQMGLAWPIDFDRDEWADIMVKRIPQTIQ